MKHALKAWLVRFKWLVLAGVVFFSVVAFGFSQSSKSYFPEVELANAPLGAPVADNAVFTGQLNARETAAYSKIRSRAAAYRGGVIEFDSELTVGEFRRIYDCYMLECEYSDYSVLTFPLSDRNEVLPEKTAEGSSASGSSDGNVPKVKRCVLYLYGSALNSVDVLTEDYGTLTNAKKCDDKLRQIDPAKKAEILSRQAQSREILNQVAARVPKQYGKNQALDYFLSWMNHNVTQDTGQEYKNVNSFEDAINRYEIPSSILSVKGGKTLCAGYAKILRYLCGRVGIESHIVLGYLVAYPGEERHAVLKVTVGGESAYIDAGNTFDYRVGAGKRMSRAELDSRFEMDPEFQM